jgi:hypothetical protein
VGTTSPEPWTSNCYCRMSMWPPRRRSPAEWDWPSTHRSRWSEPPQYIIRDRGGAYRGAILWRWSHGHRGSPDFGSIPLAKGIRRGSSILSAKIASVMPLSIAWITSLSSASSNVITCSAAIKNATMSPRARRGSLTLDSDKPAASRGAHNGKFDLDRQHPTTDIWSEPIR